MSYLGTIGALSISDAALPLPYFKENQEKCGPDSNYLRKNVRSIPVDDKVGIVGDSRLTPGHVGRDRDILFADPQMLDRIATMDNSKKHSNLTENQYTDAKKKTLGKDKTMDIGQNVTLQSQESVLGWCVGDLIGVFRPYYEKQQERTEGGAKKKKVLLYICQIRITSARKPCPKNNFVHGDGTQEFMDNHGIGGIFGEIVETNGASCKNKNGPSAASVESESAAGPGGGGATEIHVGDEIYLLKRVQSKWTCQQVHIALYGEQEVKNKATSVRALREISRLPFLEEKRFKSVALKKIEERRSVKEAKIANYLYSATAVVAAAILVHAVSSQWKGGGGSK